MVRREKFIKAFGKGGYDYFVTLQPPGRTEQL